MASVEASVPCPICGSARSCRLGWHGHYEVLVCDACSHSFAATMPSPETLERIYARYSYDDSGSLENIPPFLRSIVQRLLEGFAPHRKTNRLLDVGFGAGFVLREAAAAGWEAHGIEQSEAAVEHGRRHGIANLHHGNFLTTQLPGAPFDVVMMSELVEHLPDPLPFVRQAHRLLVPGGLLYLTTPNGRGLSARLLRTSWSVCSPPEHIHLFSSASMKAALAACGFSTTTVTTSGFNPYEVAEHVKRRMRVAPKRETFSRVACSYRLNESLTRTPLRRAVKEGANALLTAARLGDGLKVRATK